MSKLNEIWWPRRAAGFVKEGQCSRRKGPGKGRSPAAARAPFSDSGRRLLLAASSSFGPRRFQGLYGPASWPVGCTGKRPVSRGEAPSAFNSGGDEASFTSGVPHHTPPDLAVSAPLLSHTPTPVGSLVKGGVKGWGDDDDKGVRQPLVTLYTHIYIYISGGHRLIFLI